MIKSLNVHYRLVVSIEEVNYKPDGEAVLSPVLGADVYVAISKVDLSRGEAAAAVHTKGPIKAAVERATDHLLPAIIEHAHKAAKDWK